MPIFGGAKRPRLDGLTRDEEKRFGTLRSQAQGRPGADPQAAALDLLREKMAEEPDEPLWPLLLGGQMMELGRYADAIAAFEAVLQRDADEVRGYYGAGLACYRAAEYRQQHGSDAGEDVAPAGLTVDNLYQEALRHFRRGMELTPDKGERSELASSAATVVRALGRKRGRL